MGFIAPSVSSFQARAGNLPGLTIRLANRHGPSFQLVITVRLAMFGRGKTGQGERKRQQVEELFVTLLQFGRVGHDSSAFLTL